jgi:8-oxo-dGTP diphosphatase
VLPPDQYVASLGRKRMAATAFFRDNQGRVLLVNPVYKETWDLPGGAVEAEESPHAACRREVAEELGLDRPSGRLLAVDWVPCQPERPEGLIVVYDGRVLSEAEVKEIVLADGELVGFAFTAPGDVAGLRGRRRIPTARPAP